VQRYSGNVYLHTRLTNTDRRAVVGLISTLRQTLRDIDPDLPVLSITSLHRSDGKECRTLDCPARRGFVRCIRGIALLLAVVGVYGVKSVFRRRRTREIGIRMALGAHRGDVFKLIMKQGMLQTAFALGLGLFVSLGAGRVLAQMLYRVKSNGSIALATAATLLGAASLLACFFPARRATRVSPMTALRTE